MKSMKIIVAGSRDFDDYGLVEQTLKPMLDDVTEIVSGCARGADRLGERFAKEHKLQVKKFPADWDKYGKKAGYLRNTEMAEYADFLVAFWDEQSKGTLHMINQMRNKAKPGMIVFFKRNDNDRIRF